MEVVDEASFVDNFLKHYGVKGMKWGVRNDDSGVLRFQGAGPKIDPALSPSTKTAGKQVASLMEARYGFHTSEIVSFGPGDEEYELGTVAYVKSTPGQRGGVIYATQDDTRPVLKHAEEIGWSAEGCGTPKGLITHEMAHALFHAEEAVKPGLFRAKVVGGNIEARDVALRAAVQQAQKDGIPNTQFISKVSGYAARSGTRQEMEAELFSQYHWSPNPPPFVKVWGETLHQEMGLDSTPFREETVQRG